MSKVKFKYFVYYADSIKKTNVYDVAGVIFDSRMYSVKDMERALKQLNFKWELVDYYDRDVKLLSSEDKNIDFREIINNHNH